MKRLLLLAAGVIIIVLLVGAVFSSKGPTPADYRLAKGRSLLDSENYLGALETVLSLPENQRRQADAHTLLGMAYLRLHLYLAAIKEFESAEKQGSRRADPWIGLASSYIELGDGQRALDEATHATTIDPRSPDAWIMLGRAHWLQQNFTDAEKAALKTQEMAPGLPITQELLLHIYFDEDQPEKFQSTFDRIDNPSRGVRDVAVKYFVHRGEWLKAFELQTRFERRTLQSSILRTELALKREPKRMELYPALIRNLVQDGRYEDAIDASHRYKGPVPIELEVGKAYWMLGDQNAAIQQFQRASAGLVHKLSAEIALSILTGDFRHWREAYKAEHVEKDPFILSKLETVVPAAPPLIRALIYRYAGLYDSTFYNRAAEQALKVLDDDPNNLDALLTIGTAYQQLGRTNDAIRYMQQTTELYPKDAEAWARLASLTVGGKDPNATLNLMIKAVQLDPTNAGNLYNLGWMLDQVGDVPKAISFYERSIQASPLSFEAMNNLALIYEQNGQSDRAMELLQRAIDVDPELGVGYFNLGNHYVRLREWRKALQTYDRVLEINAADAMAAVEKGRIHVETGEIEAAIEDLNRALEVDSHSFDAYLLLSLAYEKSDHINEAIAAAEEAQRIRPDAPEVKDTMDRLQALGQR